jgi:two-component system sensor histidine kinase DesK
MTNKRERTTDEVERPPRSQLARWAYVVFFAFILLGPAFDTEAGPLDWTREIGVLAISISFFVMSELRGWHKAGPIGLMTIALVANFYGSSALSVLPTFAAAATAEGAVDRPQLIRRLLTLTGLTLLGFAVSPIPFPYRGFLLISIVMLWVVGMSVYEDVSLEAHADVLTAENRRIAHLATMSERERIARDLHDLAGQALTAIVLRSQIIQRIAITDPQRAAAEAETIEGMARETLDSVRATVAGWQQASLPEELHVATQSLEAAGAEVETRGEWQLDLAPSVETVMALALRESVTNVVRHAGARRVALSIDAPNGGVRLRVVDDGAGYGGREGSGLRGMRERVVAAGGVLNIDSGPGTTVTVDMPFGGRTS